jgi:hypothetical protein
LTGVEMSGADLRKACLWRTQVNKISASAGVNISHLTASYADECQPHINGSKATMEEALKVWSASILKDTEGERAVQRLALLTKESNPREDDELNKSWDALPDRWKGQESESNLAVILANLGCELKDTVSKYDTAFSIPDVKVLVHSYTVGGLVMRLTEQYDQLYAKRTAEALLTTCHGPQCHWVTCPGSEVLSTSQKDSLQNLVPSISTQQHRLNPAPRPEQLGQEADVRE